MKLFSCVLLLTCHQIRFLHPHWILPFWQSSCSSILSPVAVAEARWQRRRLLADAATVVGQVVVAGALGSARDWEVDLPGPSRRWRPKTRRDLSGTWDCGFGGGGVGGGGEEEVGSRSRSIVASSAAWRTQSESGEKKRTWLTNGSGDVGANTHFRSAPQPKIMRHWYSWFHHKKECREVRLVVALQRFHPASTWSTTHVYPCPTARHWSQDNRALFLERFLHLERSYSVETPFH